MSDYEFIKYTPTPTESYMGIAEIFLCGKYTQRFKIVMRKDGTSFFPASTSIKAKENGADVYLHSFEIDSNKEKEALNSFIIAGVKDAITWQGNDIIAKPTPSYYPSKEAQQNANKEPSFEEMPF